MNDDEEAILRGLDENGWNTQHQIYPATIARFLQMNYLVREEILELCLGNGNRAPPETLKVQVE